MKKISDIKIDPKYLRLSKIGIGTVISILIIKYFLNLEIILSVITGIILALVYLKLNQVRKSWVLRFLLVPILISLLLFSPHLWFGYEQKVPTDKGKFAVFNPISEDSLFPKLIEKLYGTQLTLSSLKICIQNNNTISNEEVEVKLPSKKDPEAGAMQLTMQYIDGSKQALYVKVNEKQCSEFPLKVVNSVNVEIRNYNTENIKAFTQANDSIVTYSLIYSELFAKIIILFLGWMIFMVNWMSSWNLIKRKIKTQI